MKSGTRDKVEGKMHQVKGKIKAAVGKIINNNELEAEGNLENIGGKTQEKLGEIKKVAER